MPKPLPLDALEGHEFVPQAIVCLPISFFAEKLHVSAVHTQDDLGDYEAIALITNGSILVELKHYAAYPGNITTIDLPVSIDNVEQISDIIKGVAFELEFPISEIFWQRSDDPSL